MTDYTDLKRRLGWLGSDVHATHSAATCAEALAAIAALEADVARKDAAIHRALEEACADDMDEWYAELRAALTPR